ncbi:PucR family transcriptional regulator [Brevibacillus dissolubilis]|uniref:PucR family transcriptional regulator n=1 Tax=Brevibacillus dissolubilis TaxID=1844116 RepID=UPI001116E3E9|nr:PucR family transcriptional regulator [Brevibacillus dissolubilis]
MNKGWMLTVDDVLKRSYCEQAEVVAGDRGLGKPVRWVHVVEVGEELAFLTGGELVLVDGTLEGASGGYRAGGDGRDGGLGFLRNDGHGNDPMNNPVNDIVFGCDADMSPILYFLQKLITCGASGVCIRLGERDMESSVFASLMPEVIISNAVRDLANRHQFPLIVLRDGTPSLFSTITRDLHETLLHLHTQRLRDAESYSRGLQRLALEAQELSRLLRYFQEAVHLQTCFLPLDGAPVYVPSMPQTVQHELTQLLHSPLLTSPILPAEHGRIPISERKELLYQPIQAMGHVLGYLVVVLFEREPDEFLHLTLDSTASAMAHLLLRSLLLEEQTLSQQDQMLDELLRGHVPEEETARTLLGVKPHELNPPVYVVAVIELERGRDTTRYEGEIESRSEQLLAMVRTVLSRRGFRVFLRRQGERLHLLLLDSDLASANHQPYDHNHSTDHHRHRFEPILTELERTFHKAYGLDTTVRFGISRASIRYTEISRRLQEAEQALRYGNLGKNPEQSEYPGSPFFEDLGYLRLILATSPSMVLEEFVEDYLGPLLRYEQKHSHHQLLLTLQTFLSHIDSKLETAERLYISRQTLYQRLEKIRELLGDGYLEPERRLCIEIALRTHQWLNNFN